MMAYLGKEDWNRLDGLLHKAGFGGYYDLLECIKDVARNMARTLPVEVRAKIEPKIEELKDIHSGMTLIMMMSQSVGKRFATEGGK